MIAGRYQSPADRLLSRVDGDGPVMDPKLGACWEWTGQHSPDGYAKARWTAMDEQLAHRVAYRLWVGPLEKGQMLDHLCRNRGCVNPAHLEIVTSAENTHRSPIAPAAINALKTHCIRNHPLSGENLLVRYTAKGRQMRTCRICLLASQERYRVRQRAAKVLAESVHLRASA